MVHFPGFAPTAYGFSRRRREFAPARFPHSDIPGSQLAYSSPRLFAVSHVLHRLLSPRHPPYALSSLTTKFTRNQILSREGRRPKVEAPGGALGVLPRFAPAAPRTAHRARGNNPAITHGADLPKQIDSSSIFGFQRTGSGPFAASLRAETSADVSARTPGVER